MSDSNRTCLSLWSHGGEEAVRDSESCPGLDFSTNINPLGLSPRGKQAMMDSLEKDILRYPDAGVRLVKETLHKVWGVPESSIALGNGATDLLYSLVRTVRPEHVYVPFPSFSEYERAAVLCHIPVTRFSVWDAEKGQPVDQLPSSFPSHSMIFICSPNNPDGHVVPQECILPLLKEADKNQSLVVVDESFIDFADPSLSMKSSLADHASLVILFSFTKFYAIPGLRAGCLLGSDKLTGRLESEAAPWMLNGPAQTYLCAALSDASYAEETREKVSAWRDSLFRELSHLPGIQPFPGRANYLLCRAESADMVQYMCSILRIEHIYIRTCGNYPGLDGSWFRTAVRKPQENSKLIEALRKGLAD